MHRISCKQIISRTHPHFGKIQDLRMQAQIYTDKCIYNTEYFEIISKPLRIR